MSRATNKVLSLVLCCALPLVGTTGCSAEQSTAVASQAVVAASRTQLQAVEYWAGNQPRALPAVKSAPAGANVMALKNLPLILKEPVVVSLGNSTYSLDQEGLYRFQEKGKVVRQAILYQGDAWRLAGHLSRLYVYGTRHQYGGLEKMNDLARSGEPVSLQCGMISLFAITHLSEHGIPARMAQGITKDSWGGYDDAHVMIELLDPVEKRWILFDVTMGTRFRKDGRLLSILDVTQLYRAGSRAEIEFVNGSSKVDPLTRYEDIYAGFNDFKDKQKLTAYVDNFKRELNSDAEALQAWYSHIMHIPMVVNSFAPGTDAEEALVRTNPGYKGLERLTPEQFRTRFYSAS